MKRLADRLERDRALRDEAWGVVREDIGLMRSDLDRRSVGGRVADRVSASAKDMAGQALKAAGAHRVALGTSALALALWLGRGPIIARLRGLVPGKEADNGEDGGEQE